MPEKYVLIFQKDIFYPVSNNSEMTGVSFCVEIIKHRSHLNIKKLSQEILRSGQKMWNISLSI